MRKHWFKSIFVTLFVISILTLIGFGITLLYFNHQTQSYMADSKSSKIVYGQNNKAKLESLNRQEFNKLYYKYIKDDNSTLKDLSKPVNNKDLSLIKSITDKTGSYYKADYNDKLKYFINIATVQNNYLKLWSSDKTFKKSVKPSTIYEFNANNYAALQTLLAVNPNSEYANWMTSNMQSMGSDAMTVERLLTNFVNYFTIPSVSKRPLSKWQVSHGYMTSQQADLQEQYSSLQYHWNSIDYLSIVLNDSSSISQKNYDMQVKVDEANDKIARVQAKKEAIARAKAAKASSEKAASEASSRASSSKIASSISESSSIEAASSSAKDESSRASSESKASYESQSRSQEQSSESNNVTDKSVVSSSSSTVSSSSSSEH